MTTAVRANRPRRIPQRATAECRPGIVLHDVSWELYERLVDELGDQHIFINFDNGEMELMSPLPAHERWKKVVARMVETLAEEQGIAIGMFGSTTIRRQDLAKGLEPDECYYIRHEADVRGKLKVDLARDPPPDLAIEIDVTHSSLDRQAIYAGLGIPEVWRFNGSRLAFLRLGPRGYVRIKRSLAFPMLTSAALQRFVNEWGTTDDTAFIRRFRQWVRETFAKP